MGERTGSHTLLSYTPNPDFSPHFTESTMTNRDKLMQKMEKMDAKKLAIYLNGTISEEINDRICKECLKAHSGQCMMELRNLKNCPRKISDWLQEEAC